MRGLFLSFSHLSLQAHQVQDIEAEVQWTKYAFLGVGMIEGMNRSRHFYLPFLPVSDHYGPLRHGPLRVAFFFHFPTSRSPHTRYKISKLRCNQARKQRHAHMTAPFIPQGLF